MKTDCYARIKETRALICKYNIRSKLIDKENLKTFEYGLWNIINGNK